MRRHKTFVALVSLGLLLRAPAGAQEVADLSLLFDSRATRAIVEEYHGTLDDDRHLDEEMGRAGEEITANLNRELAQGGILGPETIALILAVGAVAAVAASDGYSFAPSGHPGYQEATYHQQAFGDPGPAAGPDDAGGASFSGEGPMTAREIDLACRSECGHWLQALESNPLSQRPAHEAAACICDCTDRLAPEDYPNRAALKQCVEDARAQARSFTGPATVRVKHGGSMRKPMGKGAKKRRVPKPKKRSRRSIGAR